MSDEERPRTWSTELEKEMWRAGTDERPSAGTSRCAFAAVAAAAATTATTAGANAAGAGIRVGVSTFAKWVGVGVVAASVGTIALRHRLEARGGNASAPAVAAALSPAATPEAAESAAQPSTEEPSTQAPEPAPAPTPVSPAATSSAPSRAADAPSARASAPDISVEVSFIDAARRALASGNISSALSAVSQYEQKFPRGALRPEAMLLRIEAMVHKGDRTGALALAKRFLAANPSSPHAKRVRSLVGDMPTAAPSTRPPNP